jgi:hypothetical protein
MKTYDELHAWSQTATEVLNCDFAEEIRRYDSVLADLYVRAAEVNDSILLYLARRMDTPGR